LWIGLRDYCGKEEGVVASPAAEEGSLEVWEETV